MKIVIDLQACQASNKERGIGRYSFSLAQAMLAQAGNHDIQVMLNNRFAKTVVPLRQSFENLLPAHKIHVFESLSGIQTSLSEAAWRCRAAEQIRQRFITSLAPDVVHVSSLFEGWADDAVTSVFPGSTGSDTAVTLYDLIPLLNQSHYLSDPNLSRWYFQKLQSLKNADLLLSISHHSRQEALAALHLAPAKVVNISTAVDGQFRPTGLAPQAYEAVKCRHGLTRNFLMYTGGIDYRKNIEGLITAFADLPSPVRASYQLAIVCNISAPERHKLTSLAQRLGLGPHDMVCTGYVTDDDLVALYNCTTLFVFPSLHEGFGLPVLEAMACGAAVIGSDCSSIPEVIGRQDALFDPTRPQAITAKMHQALTDRAYLAALRVAGLAQARKFSWTSSAQRALAAFEEGFAQRPDRPLSLPVPRPVAERPRLAYFSPLPPARTGIADYSAELLPELARFYDIELVVAQEVIDNDGLLANFPVRQVAWFEQHAERYDRIVYHFGNSDFHQHMFALLQAHAGVVVLHDFFLSGLLNYMDNTDYQVGVFQRALYFSHGYGALMVEKAGGDARVWSYPCNKAVLDQAIGLIVHSEYSTQLAQTWYGPGFADRWKTIPLLRVMPDASGRPAARQALGLHATDFLVCAFGMLGSSKMNAELLRAWLGSTLAINATCHLCFVGGNEANAYADELRNKIQLSGFEARIRITGFTSAEVYHQYLQAADMAVQLRTQSRGETSAALLDCLANGIPTLMNNNGSSAELPGELLFKLVDEFAPADLTHALQQLHGDGLLRQKLSQSGVSYVRTQHDPARVGQLYHQAIEQHYAQPELLAYQQMLHAIVDNTHEVPPHAQDLLDVAVATSANHLPPGRRQLLVDISEFVRHDAKSGIQRVVRHIIASLLEEPPDLYRIEPVYSRDDSEGFYYAREFMLRHLGIVNVSLKDGLVETRAGDIFLGLDLNPQGTPLQQQALLRFRNRGVKVFFVVYDLLPVLSPATFQAGAHKIFTAWLQTVTAVADGLVCISRAVADELKDWINTDQVKLINPLMVHHFHLGTEPLKSVENLSHIKTMPEFLNDVNQEPVFLMVGTLEPRKSYTQALDAFDVLWAAGQAVNLVIVGKPGWMVDELLARLRQHPQRNRHLFWREGASDAELQHLYSTTTALLCTSQAEGFGLPLVEAAQHKLPLIVRDIPVFREVAEQHAYYFKGTATAPLVDALRQWLQLHALSQEPTSAGLPWLNWSQSTRQLLQCLDLGQTPKIQF